MSRHRHALIILSFVVIGLTACAGQATQPAPLVRDNLMYARQPDVQFQGGGNPSVVNVSAGARQGIHTGDAITVDDDGQARLRFSDFLVVDVYRDTQLSGIQYTASVDPSAPPVFKMRLEGGSVFSNLNAQEIAGQRISPKQGIVTDWAVIEALGTRYWVYYDEDREITWVVVQEGEVSVTGAGVPVIVRAGGQTWVEPGQRPVDPIPACRDLIGNLFPLIDDLTNRHRADLELLCQDSQGTDTAQQGTPTVVVPLGTPTAQFALNVTATPQVLCPVIELTGPKDGAIFIGTDQDVALTWQSSRQLAANEYYVVTSTFDHNGEIWRDTQETTETFIALPIHLSDLVTGARQLE